jgi:hypothetical protein
MNYCGQTSLKQQIHTSVPWISADVGEFIFESIFDTQLDEYLIKTLPEYPIEEFFG